MHYLSLPNFFKFLENLREDYQVYAPIKKANQRFYKRFQQSDSDILIGEVRAFEPLKSFFSLARERVADDFKSGIPQLRDKPFAIIGVKACDLKGFKIQDYVFKDGDCPDPLYLKMREENLIISADCTSCLDTCFCLALGSKPYPEENFDINLSQVRGGFILESGSEKGSKLLEKNSFLLEQPGNEFLKEKDDQRNKVIKRIEKNIEDNEIPYQESLKGIIEANFDSDIWADEAKTCVECGACNTICPTCHCFFLYDQKNLTSMARLRVWDSCMIKDYAKVAGGANPRARLWMRLRNRFEKKFDFFPKLTDIYACTGCGRCISSCPAKIDIRKVLRRLVSDAKK